MISILSQCPCSGGGGGSGGGINQFALLALFALAFGLWHATKWTRSTWNAEGITSRRRVGKMGLIVTLVALFAVIAGTQLVRPSATAERATVPISGIPKLLDLGSKSCIPCKMMAPILEELQKDYAGRLDVEFIDVWVKENAAKAKEFGISTIPTQIFFDASGKEIWRHEGYISKEEILGKWRELGYEFSKARVPGPDTQNASSPAAN